MSASANGVAKADPQPKLVVRDLTVEERENLLKVAANYAARGAYYRNHLQLMTERR